MTKADEAEVLRELLREAHEAMKGLRELLKTAEQREDTLRGAVYQAVRDLIAQEVADQLSQLQTQIDEAATTSVEKSEKRIYDRFDRLEAMLFGVDKESKDRGDPGIEAIAAARAVLAQAAAVNVPGAVKPYDLLGIGPDPDPTNIDPMAPPKKRPAKKTTSRKRVKRK